MKDSWWCRQYSMMQERKGWWPLRVPLLILIRLQWGHRTKWPQSWAKRAKIWSWTHGTSIWIIWISTILIMLSEQRPRQSSKIRRPSFLIFSTWMTRSLNNFIFTRIFGEKLCFSITLMTRKWQESKTLGSYRGKWSTERLRSFRGSHSLTTLRITTPKSSTAQIESYIQSLRAPLYQTSRPRV